MTTERQATYGARMRAKSILLHIGYSEQHIVWQLDILSTGKPNGVNWDMYNDLSENIQSVDLFRLCKGA